MTGRLIDVGLTLTFWLVLAGTMPTATVAQAGEGAEAPATVSLPPELDIVLRNYEAAWTARDADALAALFTDDGFVLRPGHPAAHGRDAIRAAYAGAGGPLSLAAWDFGLEGAVGFIIGGYSPGPDIPAVGKFVLALRRAASGEWLIAADMDNGN